MKIFGNEISKRNIFYYDCKICGNRRQSFFKEKAKIGLCRVCKRVQVSKDQIKMFEDDNEHN